MTGETPASRTRVNEELRAYMTTKGVRLWWENPSWQLDGQTPAQAWEAGRQQEVYDYARGGREMTCS